MPGFGGQEHGLTLAGSTPTRDRQALILDGVVLYGTYLWDARKDGRKGARRRVEIRGGGGGVTRSYR